ncbi:MAG: hypothetical protein V1867_03855 [Candidatus Falkowbacteria bacterium]
MENYIIRNAQPADFKKLALIEKRIWGKAGTAIFGKKYFNAWFKTHPQGFLVAEKDNNIKGYVYFQLIDFDLANPNLVSFDHDTDFGFTKKTHNSMGSSLYVVSICSESPGAGKNLMDELYGFMIKYGKKYAVGMVRMPGLKKYIESTRINNSFSGLIQNQEEIVLWYAIRSVEKVGGRLSKALSLKTNSLLPSPVIPDPVLTGFYKNNKVCLYGIFRNYMHDPESLGYAALTIIKI